MSDMIAPVLAVRPRRLLVDHGIPPRRPDFERQDRADPTIWGLKAAIKSAKRRGSSSTRPWTRLSLERDPSAVNRFGIPEGELV